MIHHYILVQAGKVAYHVHWPQVRGWEDPGMSAYITPVTAISGTLLFLS